MTFRDWKCDVSFADATGQTFRESGVLVLTSLGEVTLAVKTAGRFFISSFPSTQRVVGKSNDFDLLADNALVQRCVYDSQAHATQIVFVAPEITLSRTATTAIVAQHVYFKSLRVLGHCAFGDGTTKFALVQLPTDTTDQRPGLISCRLESDTAAPFRDVQVLLSLAQRCRARAPLRERYDAAGLCGVTLIPDETSVAAGHPLIPPRGHDLGVFMDGALQSYTNVRDALELPRLVDYYCLSVEATFGEFKFILASVFMEGLKFYWAKNVAQYPTVVKQNGLVRGFEKAKNKKGDPVLYTFEELISATFAHYGLNPNFTFIEDRNALFHTGAPGAVQLGAIGTWPVIRPELEILYRQADDLLLTILGYKGSIRRWERPDDDVAFP